MKRSPLKQIGVSAVAALLAVGCAAGRSPQQSPAPGAGAGNAAVGSTTGDVDACAVALGNAGTTATGAGGGGTTGTTGTTGVGTTGGTGTPAGNPGAAGTGTTTIGNGTTATGAATGTGNTGLEATANGIMIGNVALVALPSADNMPTTGATGTTGTTSTTTPGAGTAAERTGSTGTPATTGAPTTTGTAGTAGPTAIDRIRSACRGVTEIRVVTDSADRARLAQISSSIRKGQPITSYINDIARMSSKATVYTGTAGGGGAPAPGSYGTPPGQMGPGQTAAPNR